MNMLNLNQTANITDKATDITSLRKELTNMSSNTGIFDFIFIDLWILCVILYSLSILIENFMIRKKYLFT